jgi:Fe-S oxidoreductase
MKLERVNSKIRCRISGNETFTCKWLCCGAGGAQMFKDAEAGDKEINIERTEDALETKQI